MNKSAKNNKGFTPVIWLLVVAAIAVVLVFIYNENKKSKVPESGIGKLPPVSERINPEPLSANAVYVSKVDPGKIVKIDDVTLASDGYVVVQKQNSSGNRITLGSSELLKAGNISDTTITTANLVDGDAIYVSLHDANNRAIVDANGNAIEVLVNVGKLKGHQMASQDDVNSYY